MAGHTGAARVAAHPELPSQLGADERSAAARRHTPRPKGAKGRAKRHQQAAVSLHHQAAVARGGSAAERLVGGYLVILQFGNSCWSFFTPSSVTFVPVRSIT